MKKSIVSFFVLSAFSFILFGCSKSSEQLKENIEKVYIFEMMNSFSKVNEDSKIIISDSKEITDIKEAVNSAEKLSGIVDVAEPHYKIEIGEEAYFLWLIEESGTIMDVKDTNTVYKLSNKSVQRVNELITNKVGN